MAITVREYAKAFFSSIDIEELIPYSEFLNETTCALKTNGLTANFRVQPIDDECLSPTEKAAEISQLIAAEGLLGTSYRQLQYLFRTREFDVDNRAGEHHSTPVREMEDRRSDHLKSVKGATIEIYHALEALPGLSAKQLTGLSARDRSLDLHKLHAEFDEAARSYIISLDNLGLQRLDQQLSFKLWSRLLNPGQRWKDAPDYQPGKSISSQLRHVSVAWDDRHDCLRVGDRAVRVLTLKALPDFSYPNTFGDLLKIDANLTVVTTWQPEDVILTHDKLIRLRRLMINLEQQGLTAGRAIRQDPTLRDVLQESGVRDDLHEINDLLGQIRHERHTGHYTLTILLHDKRPEDLHRPAAELETFFRLRLAALHEERQQWLFGTALPVFFQTLAGNSHFDLRWHPLRDDHHADFSTIWAPDVGDTSGQHAAVYQTRMGPLHRTARKYDQAGNRCTFGRTRTGKTVSEIEDIASRQVEHPITRIYDAGGSYIPLAAYFRGEVLRVSLKEWNKKICPFRGPEKDPDFYEDCINFVRFLIECDGYQCTDDDSLQLGEWVPGLFRLDPEQRQLQTLWDVIEGPMKRPLARWVQKGPGGLPGQYGFLFDHAEDDLVESDFRVIEFERVADGTRHAWLEALLLLLMGRDLRTILDPANLERAKLFTFDECQAHWQHDSLSQHIIRILTRFPKKNTLLSLVMQSPEQLGALQPFVLQNCTSFKFFRNPKITDAVLQEFGMDETRRGVFRGLKRHEHLLHANLGEGRDLWKVLIHTIDPYRYWLSTTTPEEVAKRERVFRAVGPLEGLKQLAAEGAA